eukprot:10345595-Lingulodinium_polyedra.AAC.1
MVFFIRWIPTLRAALAGEFLERLVPRSLDTQRGTQASPGAWRPPRQEWPGGLRNNERRGRPIASRPCARY